MQPSTGLESKRTAPARSMEADIKSRKWTGDLSPAPYVPSGHLPQMLQTWGRAGWGQGSSRSGLYLGPHLCPCVALIGSYVRRKVCMLEDIRIVQREKFLEVSVSDPTHHILVGRAVIEFIDNVVLGRCSKFLVEEFLGQIVILCSFANALDSR